MRITMTEINEQEESEYFPFQVQEEKKDIWQKLQEKMNRNAEYHAAEIRFLESIEDNADELPGWRKAMRRLGRTL